MKLTITFLTSLVAAVALSSHGTAHSSNGYTWASNRVVMRAHQASFPAGSDFRTMLSTIEDRFLFEQPSPLYFDFIYDDQSCSLGNSQSEIWFTSEPQSSSALAYKWYNYSARTIVKADIVFYTGEDFTTSASKTAILSYGGFNLPFDTALIHELCHVAGLDHEDDEYNIMGEDYTHITCNGSEYRGYIGEDAGDGLVSLYGQFHGYGREDVGVTLFKRTGQSGEYSDHGLCRMYTSSGGYVGSSWFQGQKRYTVHSGGTFQAEFTYENNGANFLSDVDVGFYLSTNPYISKSDTRIGSMSLNLGRGDVYTVRRRITLPSNLSYGQVLYLGVIIDDDERLLEFTEDNNAAYHIVKVF